MPLIWQSFSPSAVLCKCVIILQFCPCPYSSCCLQSWASVLHEREAHAFNNKDTFHNVKFSMKTINFYTVQERNFSIKKTARKQTATKPQHNVILPYNILHFVLGSFSITLYLAMQLLQTPFLLFCITGSLWNLPSFPQNVFSSKCVSGTSCREMRSLKLINMQIVKLSVYMLWNNSLCLFPHPPPNLSELLQKDFLPFLHWKINKNL